MATVLDAISIKGLRPAHFRQLASYIEAAEWDGWYYGPKDQFFKRHHDLKEWIDEVLKLVYDEGTVIPKK